MTLANPAFAIQASSHSAQLFREAVSSMLAPAGGIVQGQDFALTQNGTPNMSVNVGAGRLWLPGTSLSTVNPGGGAYYPQGLYYTESDAAVNLAISASSPSNPRIDTVICQVQDAAYAGVTNSATLAVLTGTPAPGATLSNLTGAASVPASSYVLGYVLVPANATTIVTADLSSTATPLAPGLGGGGGATNIAASQSTSSTSYTTLATPDQVTGVVLPPNGLIAVWYQATWQESVTNGARAAIFVGSNQLQIQNYTSKGPGTQAAVIDTSEVGKTCPLYTFSAGLACSAPDPTTLNYSADVTTGQIVGGAINALVEIGGTIASTGQASALGFGGPCYIFAAAGTYTISVQFKASSGSLTASNRKLWVQALTP